jgi:hypothetical protein
MSEILQTFQELPLKIEGERVGVLGKRPSCNDLAVEERLSMVRLTCRVIVNSPSSATNHHLHFDIMTIAKYSDESRKSPFAVVAVRGRELRGPHKEGLCTLQSEEEKSRLSPHVRPFSSLF